MGARAPIPRVRIGILIVNSSGKAGVFRAAQCQLLTNRFSLPLRRTALAFLATTPKPFPPRLNLFTDEEAPAKNVLRAWQRSGQIRVWPFR